MHSTHTFSNSLCRLHVRDYMNLTAIWSLGDHLVHRYRLRHRFHPKPRVLEWVASKGISTGYNVTYPSFAEVTCMCFIEKDLLITGDLDGCITIFNTVSMRIIHKFKRMRDFSPIINLVTISKHRVACASTHLIKVTIKQMQLILIQ